MPEPERTICIHILLVIAAWVFLFLHEFGAHRMAERVAGWPLWLAFQLNKEKHHAH